MSEERKVRKERRTRKKATEAQKTETITPDTPVAQPTPVAAPAQPAPATKVNMPAGEFHPADTNGDGIVTKEEEAMYLEFKRKELEDADAMRDAQRSMAWFALFGMLLYPFAVVLAVMLGLDSAATILGNMAATYFVSVAAIVAAFFGGQALATSKSKGRK